MFFFDIDDMFDGMSFGIGMIIKFAIFIALLAPPILAFEARECGAVSIFGMCLIIVAFIINVITIIKAIRRIMKKEIKVKNLFLFPSDKIEYDKLKKNGYIVLIGIIILSVIGYIFPVYLSFINFKISNIAGAIILPFIFNIVFSLLMDENLHTTRKYTIRYTFDIIKDYMVDTVFRIILRSTIIIFYIYSLAVFFTRRRRNIG